jgi:hypothetical protein
MRDKAIVAIMAGLALAGCSAGRDKAAAETGVATFHQMLDAGRYHDIYAGADPAFRSTASEQEGLRVLQMIHDRLGGFRSSQQSGWRVNYGTGGSIVNLTYDSQFASAAGTEDFVFRIEGNAPHLVGYHVNSPALTGSGATGAGASSPGASGKPGGAAPPPAPIVSTEPAKPPEPAGGK